MNWVWPLATSLLALVFALLLLRQFLERRRIHQLVWAWAFWLFFFAAFAEFYSEVWGWNTSLYKGYYVAAAALVAYLGAGTVYLILGRGVGHLFTLVVTALSLLMLSRALGANVMVNAFVPGKVVAGQAMAPEVRVLSPLLTIPGSLALLGGALYSWARGRAVHNLFIAAGTIIIAGAGGAARFGMPSLLYGSEMVGLFLLFHGFLKSRETLRSLPRRASMK
ncbi:hypothetical protein SY88_13825 [Clostridiales bacterium PH28_bin88]|nr:hypothetical protein SY88_13825 [Clostridiales bacterium PH28_bin88]